MKLLRNARIPHGSFTRVVDILHDERILQVLPVGECTHEGVDTIDAEGYLALPGAIDTHVHFNDPGFTQREDFASGTCAAAAGGVTTVVDMPCTSLPPVTSVAALEHKLAAIGGKAHVDYALWGGIRGGDIDQKEIERLWEAGVVGFKSYTVSGMDTFSALSPQEMDIVAAMCRGRGVLLAFHAEDPTVIAKLAMRQWDWADFAEWSRMRPAEAEETAVRDIISRYHGCRMHIVHVGAKTAVMAVLAAREAAADITWETAPHYLAFTSEDLARLKGRLKTAPPVKSAADRDFLRDCLIDGRLDWVASDHAGCDWNTGKTAIDLREVYNGIPCVQWQLPWLASEFLATERITPARLAELTSGNPARRLGIWPRKGCLDPGSDADFVLLDCASPWTAREQDLLSLGKFSPFNGQCFSCRVRRTILRGESVYVDGVGVIGKRGCGHWVRRISH
ncbi:MAG: dihydroorotase family protein [Candidatus Cloacimonetes bacterium]|nr:dihydroorotase family protein [Candidatus Cloacimonadota bacterium]